MTKVRVVYDASAKTQKDLGSLNDCLFAGPYLLPDLCGILLRFRLFPMAMCSDVEKAFLQLSLNPSNRDVTRLFWLRDINAPVSPENIQVFRFCRVLFGVVSSLFLLSATIAHHLNKEDNIWSKEILRNTYVDNVTMGTNSECDATEYYHHAKSIFSTASMNLREWLTNSEDVQNSIPPSDRSSETEKPCLGMRWNTKQDTIRVAEVKASAPQITTKRGVLSTISSVFDPLGLHSLVTVKVKILMQVLWKEKLDWDEPLTEAYQQRWNIIADDLDQLSFVTIPRFFGLLPSDITSLPS